MRLNENLSYTYDASGNLASRLNNTLAQAFTCDALEPTHEHYPERDFDGEWQCDRGGGYAGGERASRADFSDGTFATTAGLALRDGNNLFVTAGSNAAGALVVSTITSNRLPVTVSFVMT